MKLIFVLFFWISYSTIVLADDYRILFINDNQIIVNGVIKKTGDVINDTDKIMWSHDHQVIKVQNTKNGSVKIITAKQMNKNNTIKDYYLKQNKLSTRDVVYYKGITSCTLEDLANNDQNLQLSDSLLISAELNLKEGDYVFITYEYENKKVEKQVEYSNNNILIVKTDYPDAMGEYPTSICGYSKSKDVKVELIHEVKIRI